MKINHDKYPILQKLEQGIFGVIGMSESDALIIPMHSDTMAMVRDTFKANIPYFKKSIRYITEPLYNAMTQAREKLLATELIMDLSSCSGTYLVGDLQICYNISALPGVDKWEYVCYCFAGDRFMSFTGEDGKRNYSYGSSFWFEIDNPSMEGRKEIAKQQFYRLLMIINFLKYAEIQVKHLQPNRQIWDGPNCLYNNKSKYPVEIMDSTWFTTLVKSDAFKVRGHFRLQPYGEGLTKRKLVWINEFQKDGYTRQAKKLETTTKS
jgi:hypothetical protein